jgi:hypothetical protein
MSKLFPNPGNGADNGEPTLWAPRRHDGGAAMSNAQRLYDQTCRHLRAVQANIDRLAELGANEKLALLCGRLQRLSFRAAPATTEEGRAKEEEHTTNFTFIT